MFFRFLTGFFLAVFAGLTLTLSAQNEAWSDTVRLVNGPKTLSHPFKRWKADLQLDGRWSVINDARMQIGGIRFGLEHKRVHRFGIGFFNWSSAFSVPNPQIDLLANVESVRTNTSYITAYYERVYFFSRKWETAITLHLGAGTIQTSYLLAGEEAFRELDPERVNPVELSTSGFYHLTWWLSFGGGMGYRYMRNSPDAVKEVYNAPVYIAKAKVRLGRLVRRINNPEVKDEY